LIFAGLETASAVTWPGLATAGSDESETVVLVRLRDMMDEPGR
jgi:hypothetical protein